MPNKIKEYILKNIITKIVGLLWLLFGSLLLVLGPLFFRSVFQSLSKDIALLMLGETLIIILILLAFIFVLFKYKLKFGIYWDKKHNPHCPSCKHPLRVQGVLYSSFNLYCVNCKQSLSIRDDDGNTMTLIDAKKLL